ncbi:PREDICTED: clumping factor B-like [Prunus mume]|uniref:Clumping factor B-like n=1 Tax=Prunus mume TaxID=102107 RepID=A0ABM0NYY8_PRUMU|nr:PREDICTED: clumping factor B-like [Prunus mume]
MASASAASAFPQQGNLVPPARRSLPQSLRRTQPVPPRLPHRLLLSFSTNHSRVECPDGSAPTDADFGPEFNPESGSFFDDPDPDPDYDDDDDLDSDSDNDLDPHSDDDSDPDPEFVFDSDPDPDFDSDFDPDSGSDPDLNSY